MERLHAGAGPHGRVVANPLQGAFDRPVVWGDDIEAGPIFTESANPQSSFLAFSVTEGPRLSYFGRILAPLGIGAVVLAKVPGWRSYAWLGRQRDLLRTFESSTIVVYESTAAGAARLRTEHAGHPPIG